MESSMNEDLVRKFQDLESKHKEFTAEKLKYEAKKDQLTVEIKSIQDKYPEYDLSTVESVEKLISELESKLESEIKSITDQYAKFKAAM